MDPVSILREFFRLNRFKAGSRFIVAASAGPDSTALAWGLKSLQNEFSYKFRLGHVNHRLRGKSSDADERFVRRLATQLGWPCDVRSRPINRSIGNLEGQARVERYDALFTMAQKVRAKGILTAHTREDQVETILLSLLRGTGPEGLSGMPVLKSWTGRTADIMRPLIPVGKSDLKKFLAQGRHNFRHDASNDRDVFKRNWIRKHLSPKLEKQFPGFQVRIGRLAEILRDEAVVWDEILAQVETNVERIWRGRPVLDIKGLLSYPAALQRRLLRRRPGGDLLTFDGVEKLRGWLRTPPTGGRLWQLRKGWVAERLSRSKGVPSAHWLWIRPTSHTRKIS